jgi:hypothetical protein
MTHNRPSSCPMIDSFKEAPSLCLPVVHEARGDQVRSPHGGRCVCLPLPVHQLSKVFIANPSVGAASPSHENDSWLYQSNINNYIGINPIIVVSRGITTSAKREATAKSSGVTLIIMTPQRYASLGSHCILSIQVWRIENLCWMLFCSWPMDYLTSRPDFKARINSRYGNIVLCIVPYSNTGNI